jgi:hypothetical protein
MCAAAQRHHRASVTRLARHETMEKRTESRLSSPAARSAHRSDEH